MPLHKKVSSIKSHVRQHEGIQTFVYNVPSHSHKHQHPHAHKHKILISQQRIQVTFVRLFIQKIALEDSIAIE